MNNLFFKKGFCLFVLFIVFGIEISYANNDNKDYYSKLTGSAEPTGTGIVYVDNEPNEATKTSSNGSAPTHTYSIEASPYDGYIFLNWTASGANITDWNSASTNASIAATSTNKGDPAIGTVKANFGLAAPTIKIHASTGDVVITHAAEGVAVYYTTNGVNPTASSSMYEGPFSVPSNTTVKAIAQKGNLTSTVASSSRQVVTVVSTQEELQNMKDGYYLLTEDVELSSDFTSIEGFKGTFDGNYKVITGLTKPLFSSTDGATIKNVVLDDVNISGTGNVGAIVAEASGNTRIYNCGVRATGLLGSKISGTGTGYTGSIVGYLKGSSRVINCYSFADIIGDWYVGGIVGYNATASTSSNLQTLVMNCMFYGNIAGGTNKAPIYNGEKITNAGSTGINNYNYYRYSSDYSLKKNIDTYNCALAAEERFLVRHEFYRGILNSQRKLCAYYVTGSVDNASEIDKWVLDKNIAPYPIIKPWGKYPSEINKVPTDKDTPYHGKILGKLNVNISGYGRVSLDITDMDTLNYDYNYYKVQLPYYNDYFNDQYTNNKVVTGWKITNITGGTTGTFSTTGDNRYNFADRNCTAKDLYSTTGVVFAQGGYYNVPEGVTEITIEPYIAKNVVYLSDAYYDKVYSTEYSGSNFRIAGATSRKKNGKDVYISLIDAINALGSTSTSTVYDNAIVLVGNYHSLSETWSNDSKSPFTLMSIDEDKDNEPDYCVFHGHSEARVEVNPVRFDFLWHPGIGMAKKVEGSEVLMPNQSIFRPLGWFEITETCLARYTEFEYDYDNSNRTASPMILNNGIFEQFMSLFGGTSSSRTTYLRLGGNAYFEAFTPGTHTAHTSSTVRPPVSVCGGEYKTFYLSGVRPDAITVDGNALCYTNGGKFPLFAGAYMEKIAGDVIVKMDHSYVHEFYGGGVNSVSSQITGNVNITINNSLVNFYCGGPKFGGMNADKTVITNAVGTTFGEFYGAGYGGTSYYIKNVLDGSKESSVFNGSSYGDLYTSFASNNNGYATNYHLEFFSYAGGTGKTTISRFYVHYASLTFATTNDVFSTLTNCVVKNDFYGGGHLGVVNGIATSTLNNCTIMGNAYGGGYSAAVPTCIVRTSLPTGYPTLNTNTGVFEFVDFPKSEYYTWSDKIKTVDQSNKLLPTSLDLGGLGEVKGGTIITINGNTKIEGKLENGVYGGGNESKVSGTTEVNIAADANASMINNVYGGANRADVGRNTTVNIRSGKIGNVFGANNKSGVKSQLVNVNVTGGVINNVYGAGNLAAYAGNPVVLVTGGSIKESVYGGGLGQSATVTGNPQVNISGGTIGYTKIVGQNEVVQGGDVFGGGNAAPVQGNTSVTITGGEVKRNVYGGGNQAEVSGTTTVTIGQKRTTQQ